MYDRRNGPMRPGDLIYLKEATTWEVTTRPTAKTTALGWAIAAINWPWWHRVLWALQWFPERGKWAPIRFCFIQEAGTLLL